MRALAGRLDGRAPYGPDGSEQRCVLVIGAGISGLVAAFELRSRGVDVVLCESSRQVGGNIQTTHSDGFLVEHGAQSFTLTSQIESLIVQLGLSHEVVDGLPNARRKMVACGANRLVELPNSLRQLFTSPLLSLRARLGLLREPFVARDEYDHDECVASFVLRRFGREVLDVIVDPLLRLQCGGTAYDLSMEHLFPRLIQLERTHGSITRALFETSRRQHKGWRKLLEEDTHCGEFTRSRVVSFRSGMHTLTRALERSLTGVVKLNCPARVLHRDDSRWVVETGPDGSGRPQLFDAVVIATAGHVMAINELPAEVRRYSVPIERIYHPPVSTLTFGFRRSDIAHPLDMGSILVPSIVSRSRLGVTIGTSMFECRAPDDHVTITCTLGGSSAPDVASWKTEDLAQHALDELSCMLPIQSSPVFQQRAYWPHGMPQYGIGHSAVTRAADSTELMNPGLYLAGNYRNGSSIGDCVESGRQVAQRVAVYLARTG